MVAELSRSMSEKDLTSILSMLKRQVASYEAVVLLNKPVRQYIYALYNDKIHTGHAITKLSRTVNQSKKGSTKKLALEIEQRVKAAHAAEPVAQTAAAHLQGVQLDYGILLSPEVLELAESGDSVLDPSFHYGIIEGLWDELYAATIKLAGKVAKEQTAPLSGDVVQYEDLFQQAAGIELRRAIERYVPLDLEHPVRAFVSYVTNTTRYNVSHYVAEQSRTVPIPRYMIDRYRPVLQAIEEGFLDYTDLANRSTQIVYEKRAPRKLKPSELYTADEVYRLMAVMQECDSLDAEVAVDESGQPATLADRIEDPKPDPEQVHDAKHSGRKLMEIVSDYCDSEEYTIMELRWGMGKVVGLKDTADRYRETVGRAMNKTKVAAIESNVFERLRRGAAEGDGRLKEIAEVLEEIS